VAHSFAYPPTPWRAAVPGAAHRALRVLGDDWAGTAMRWQHPATFGRVGYDARFEQCTSHELSAFSDFPLADRPGWQRVMAGYDVVVSRREHPRLASALGRLPGRRVTCQDSDGVVLERVQ
jgi:hypothetical protein